METWNNRLAKALKNSGMTKSAVAAETGVSVPTLSAWVGAGNITPATTITAENLIRVCRVLKVRPEWILFREGPPEVDADSEEFFDDFAMLQRLDVKASAGSGNLVFLETDKGRLAFRRDFLRQIGVREADAKIIYADGQSMEPKIPDGAVLLIDTGNTSMRNNDIHVIRVDGEILVKRLRKEIGGGVWIVSDNPDKGRYPDILVTPDKEDHIAVIGRVFWMGARL